MKYYAIYDEQLNGFKAGLAFEGEGLEGMTLAFEAAADRVESLHLDVFFEDDNETAATTWEEYREEYNLTSTNDFITFFDYSVREVSKKDFEKIIASDEIGMTTTVSL